MSLIRMRNVASVGLIVASASFLAACNPENADTKVDGTRATTSASRANNAADGTFAGTLTFIAPGKLMIDEREFSVAEGIDIQGSGGLCGAGKGQPLKSCSIEELVAAAKSKSVKVKVTIKGGDATKIVDQTPRDDSGDGDTRPDAGAHVDSCTTEGLTFSTSDQPRPINHIMLHATNLSDSACRLVGYPYLAFSADQQAVTRVLEDSKPKDVVVLKPGATAYASINIADGSGESEGPVEKITDFKVMLQDFGGESTDPVTVPTPGEDEFTGEPLSVDIGAAFVTYWHSNAADAANNS
ncbi:DUF4232 domain-containing protein [Streptomyces sp. NPDC002870]|uniref:DUF4232 domain-containing protein n=1 Tax=Streptomyces sp. NPDC002870 TaxID=3364666 RepID=UPI0036A268C4